MRVPGGACEALFRAPKASEQSNPSGASSAINAAANHFHGLERCGINRLPQAGQGARHRQPPTFVVVYGLQAQAHITDDN